MLPKLALICGILAPLLFVFTDVVAGTSWKGYSFVWKSISELSAIGAPTRPFAAPLFIAQSLLLVAFGLGVWGQAGQNTPLRVIAGFLVGNGIVSLAATSLFPMRVGVVASALSVGVILGAAGVIFLLVAVGFGAAAFTNWFRFYSIGTLLTFAVLTIFGLVAQNPGHGRVGLQERVMSYGFLLWIGLLTVVLLSAGIGTGRGAESAVN